MSGAGLDGHEGYGWRGAGVAGTIWITLALCLLLPLPPPPPRHEVEEQVLGQIPGDRACGDCQRQPAQVSTVSSRGWACPRAFSWLQVGPELW